MDVSGGMEKAGIAFSIQYSVVLASQGVKGIRNRRVEGPVRVTQFCDLCGKSRDYAT